MVPYKVQGCFISVKNAIGILIGITLNLQIAFDSIYILTVLILPIHEHGVSAFICVFFSFLHKCYIAIITVHFIIIL